jgi:hypothetical protein
MKAKTHSHHSMALPKPFPNNPRKITPERLAALGESLIEFGDLSAIIINVGKGRYKNCIVSANQRSKHIPLDEITWTLEHDKPTAAGTVREGYVLHGGERFSVREVSWNERKCEIANLRANNYGGQNDVAILKFFDEDVLQLGGVSMIFESGPVQFNPQDALPDSERTESPTVQFGNTEYQPDIPLGRVEQAYQIYTQNNIRQVVLYFEGERYGDFIAALNKFKEDMSIEDNTKAVEKLLELYGNANQTRWRAFDALPP